jgi:hypothetical protein
VGWGVRIFWIINDWWKDGKLPKGKETKGIAIDGWKSGDVWYMRC